jgi:two-component system, sensor histidine kinase and response regulator
MIMSTPGPESSLSGYDASFPQTAGHSGQEVVTEGVFDRAAELMRVEGDPELLVEIIEVFLDDSPRLLSRIREALKREDLKLLEQAAHTLKGSVGNFCAPVAYAAALKLEKIGREGNVEKAQEARIDLEEAMEQLRPALQLLRDGAVA